MVTAPSRSTSGLRGTFSPSTVGNTACVVVEEEGLVETDVLVTSGVTAGNSAVLVVAGVGGAVGSGATTVSGSEPQAIRTSAHNPGKNKIV